MVFADNIYRKIVVEFVQHKAHGLSQIGHIICAAVSTSFIEHFEGLHPLNRKSVFCDIRFCKHQN